MNLHPSLLFSACCAALLIVGTTAQATTIDIGRPYNRLWGAATNSSSVVNPSFLPARAVDNQVRAVPPNDQDHGLIFGSFDPDQRLGLTGPFAPFGKMRKLRIWTIPSVADERIPNSVTVRSSLNILSGAALITAANYETALGSFPLGIGAFTGTAAGTDNTFATLAINAPAGTRSLYLSFGSADFKAERISEVQAFIPEPGTFFLAGLAFVASAFVRRQR
jgi:hypothetical protein